MTKLGIVPIKIDAKLFDQQQIKRIMLNTIEGLARDIKVDFKVTTQTWNDKPKFSIDRTGSNGRVFYRVIGTDNDIYKFVSGGTRVRYAVMTVNFKAKSRVRVIGSGAGRGGFSHFNFKKPKPGIKARKFDDEIAKKWQRLIPAVVERALLQEIPTK